MDVDASRLRPMLAVPGTPGEVTDGFAYEFKWDGVRTLALVDADGALTLRSRRGNDVTARYPELHALGEAVGTPAVLDGEVVAFDAERRPSFGRLQQRMNLSSPARIARATREVPVAYLAFDLLRLGEIWLLDQPYEARREVLEGLGLAGPHWQVPPRHDDLGTALQIAGDLDLEGVVAKRLGSRYRPGERSRDWVKLRRWCRQEFVVGGYRKGQGGRAGTFGSLLLGYHDADGALRFAGSVGSGFTDAEVSRLQAELDRRIRPDSPFADPVPHRDVVYVDPELVVEVRFSEWTHESIVRQSTYLGQRDDKDPADVVRET